MTTTDAPAMPAGLMILGPHFNGFNVVIGIDAGHRAGLFDLAAKTGPATSAELAAAGGLSERHVREWLALMAAGHVFDYEPATQRFTMTDDLAMFLTGTGMSFARMAADVTMQAALVPRVAQTLVEGGGIGYDELPPEWVQMLDESAIARFGEGRVNAFVETPDGLGDRLRAGITVCEIGCGSGRALNALAQSYPASSFVGYDIGDKGLEIARSAVTTDNVSFERCDVAAMPADAHFDLVLAFDCIHDQAHPRTVLAEVRRVLADDGVFLMIDPGCSSHLAQNLEHPAGALLYGMSLFHCMQVSLAQGGEGLGTACGIELSLELLAEAGFTRVENTTVEVDPFNAVYICRP